MGSRLERPGAERVSGARAEQIRLLRGDKPEDHYPAEARQLSVDGYAAVDLLLNEDGFVLEASVFLESPPDAGFGLAALDVAKTYEFYNPLKKLVLLDVVISFLP